MTEAVTLMMASRGCSTCRACRASKVLSSMIPSILAATVIALGAVPGELAFLAVVASGRWDTAIIDIRVAAQIRQSPPP